MEASPKTSQITTRATLSFRRRHKVRRRLFEGDKTVERPQLTLVEHRTVGKEQPSSEGGAMISSLTTNIPCVSSRRRGETGGSTLGQMLPKSTEATMASENEFLASTPYSPSTEPATRMDISLNPPGHICEIGQQNEVTAQVASPESTLSLESDVPIRTVRPATIPTEDTSVDSTTCAQLGPTSEVLESGVEPLQRPSALRKLARNSGQSYFTEKGKFVPSKKFQYHKCECHYNCNQLSEEERKGIFERFWASQNWQAQSNFIASTVTEHSPKRSCKASRSVQCRSYFFENVRVCSQVYFKTLGISRKRVDYCLRQKCKHKICSPDKRGSVCHNKTSDYEKRNIKIFLDSFPKFKSHYSESNKFYFHENLTRSILYDHYVKRETECNRKVVSKPIFYKEFAKYNIGIYVPKKDTCAFCDSTAMKLKSAVIVNKAVIQSSLAKHHERAQEARDKLNESRELAKKDSSVLSFSFDMQKTQPLPRLNTSSAFYKRQLWVYNVGINTGNNNKGYMAMWLESEGKRGSNEICSSILAFLNYIDCSSIKKVETFSDCCGGQNRNKTVICFFKYMCDTKGFESWEHTFMESGHSFLPNDQDFGVIEKKAKNKLIYSKKEWYDLVATSRKHSFEVIDMKNNFFDMKALVNSRIFNPSRTNASENFNFLKLKSFKVIRNSPIVSYKTTEKGEEFLFDYPSKRGDKIILHKSSGSVPISKEKYEDVMHLLKYVPPVYHKFYRDLPHV